MKQNIMTSKIFVMSHTEHIFNEFCHASYQLII